VKEFPIRDESARTGTSTALNAAKTSGGAVLFTGERNFKH
jgi:hypothetical protein